MDFYSIFFEDIKDPLFEYYTHCFEEGTLSSQTQIGLNAYARGMYILIFKTINAVYTTKIQVL